MLTYCLLIGAGARHYYTQDSLLIGDIIVGVGENFALSLSATVVV